MKRISEYLGAFAFAALTIAWMVGVVEHFLK